MRIGNSCIEMTSKRSYQETKVAQSISLLSFKGTETELDAKSGDDMFSQLKKASEERSLESQMEGMKMSGVAQRPVYNSNGTRSVNSIMELKNLVLEMLLDRWDKKKSCFYDKPSNDSITQGINQGIANAQATVSLSGTYVLQTVQSSFYSEKETTAFCTSGSVTTKDGRSFDINFSFEMSRSFQVTYEEYTKEEFVLCDPLVINFGGDVTELSDQKFLFDLDCDGKKEEISQFASNSGFLAMDHNGDGIINDGSELFGTKSGNGFEDLAKYDLDGNGWIDEDDSAFSKLKVWTKSENGNNILMSIKDAGVGAIYLGTANTRFALNNLVDNSTNGVIQKSGIYLMENGEANTIMHVDFAV